MVRFGPTGKILVHCPVYIFIFAWSQFYKRRHRKLMNHGVGISSFRRPQTAKPVSVSKLVQPHLRPTSSKSSTSISARRTSGTKILRFSFSENCHGDGPKTERRPKTAKGAQKCDMKSIEENKTFTKSKSRPATAPPPVMKKAPPIQPPTQVWKSPKFIQRCWFMILEKLERDIERWNKTKKGGRISAKKISSGSKIFEGRRKITKTEHYSIEEFSTVEFESWYFQSIWCPKAPGFSWTDESSVMTHNIVTHFRS